MFNPMLLIFVLAKCLNRMQHRLLLMQMDPIDGYFYLYPGTYEVVMENIVTIGPHEAGWVITRSTLNRNGIFLTSGLYDSGYSGVMAAAMHIFGDGIKIEPGSRIGQFLLFKSESIGTYEGSYGAESEHDKNYIG
jgi:deoxycytidine triphosphate deaminase